MALPRPYDVAQARGRQFDPFSSLPTTQLKKGCRRLASRASFRTSFSGRRSRSESRGRPIISAPSDFRKVEISCERRRRSFRPLELSIYLPENRLSPLPRFGADVKEEDDRHETIELPYPDPALMRSRPGSLLSHRSSSFLIPRKPVPSSPYELNNGRYSIDSVSSPFSTATEWVAQPLRPRPGMPDSPSTQDLIASLQKRLPQTPPLTRVSYSEDGRPSVAGSRFREIGTIPEEKQVDVSTSAKSAKEGYFTSTAAAQSSFIKETTSSHISPATPHRDRPLPPTPHLIDEKSQSPPSSPPEQHKHSQSDDVNPRPSSKRTSAVNRLTQWLFRSPSWSPTPNDVSEAPPFYQLSTHQHNHQIEQQQPQQQHEQDQETRPPSLSACSTISTLSTARSSSEIATPSASSPPPPQSQSSSPRSGKKPSPTRPFLPIRQLTFGRKTRLPTYPAPALRCRDYSDEFDTVAPVAAHECHGDGLDDDEHAPYYAGVPY
ncbi:MAG: hypothetical protein M1819_005291 [Sarea resinae]|nr:MAG: hypothetical protein M1819_005291 [Sarea resinae]